jgi:hypothetical protein
MVSLAKEMKLYAKKKLNGKEDSRSEIFRQDYVFACKGNM